MRHIEIRKLIWSALLVLGLSTAGAVSPSFAQGTGAAGTADAATTQTADDDDDGMDLGWLGLLGLAGLLGLRRREPAVVRDRTDMGTTHTRP